MQYLCQQIGRQFLDWRILSLIEAADFALSLLQR